MAPKGHRAHAARRVAFGFCLAVGLIAVGARMALAQAAETHETQYVIEQLVVSVSATADGSGEHIGQIKSGDRVEVLERQADQSRVRLPSGQEGWVRTSYLSSSPPLREQLKASTDELDKLRQDKTKLEADLASARKAASTLAESNAASHVAATPPTSVASVKTPIGAEVTSQESAAPAAPVADAGTQSNPSLFSSEGMMPSRPSWLVALVASVAALVVGFVLGWRMLDRRIRAKYGGLRIY